VARDDEEARLDRELIELLNELRVALPGVQVLFAFLLTLPFTNRFEKISGVERLVYFVALLATTLASALMIAPSAYHRLRARDADKEQLIQTSSRLLIGGMAALVVAITCAVYVIADLIYGAPTGILTAAATAVVFGWFWWGLPLTRRG
jgi:phosphatidylserine synthase